MAGGSATRQENYSRSKSWIRCTPIYWRPVRLRWLNAAQREVLGKMLMNIAYDLMRDDQDERSDAAEALAERLFQEQEE